MPREEVSASVSLENYSKLETLFLDAKRHLQDAVKVATEATARAEIAEARVKELEAEFEEARGGMDYAIKTSMDEAEQAKAKLAKAVEALRKIASRGLLELEQYGTDTDISNWAIKLSRHTLRDIEGGG
jgi:hypothetical protein